ncbi:hypothetical protein [Colwellia psychrerythraea]|uniref:Putative lipoprotein n=1 Tax=Colwellia psychrerythraea (strain 34H / ATCC BAA-681) TaxID=167879 RepID=Q481V9_COLP3|nr:hypothetical protein [Colwellia psychrerythraea]AAZ25935.1 putative lipoprotein [Colwellia psychrerythraea 34H]
MRLSKVLLISSLSLFLCSCAVMPTFTEKFDEKCQAVQKKVVLSIEDAGMFGELECPSKDDCKAQLLGQILGSVIIFPVSAIISGSIAVIGNSVYWLNEQGQCGE